MADVGVETGGEVQPEVLPPPPRRPWRRFVLLAILLIAGSVFGWHYLQQRREFEGTDDAQLTGDVIPVTSDIAYKERPETASCRASTSVVSKVW